MKLLYDGSDPIERLLTIFTPHLEGTLGLLVMYSAFFLALMIGVVNLGKSRSVKVAAGLLLFILLLFIALLLAFERITSGGQWDQSIFWLSGLGLALQPLVSSIVLFLCRSRRAAVLVICLWILSITIFVSRALVSADICGSGDIPCGGAEESCVKLDEERSAKMNTITFDGPGSQLPHSVISDLLMYIEGMFGGLVMVLSLFCAILVGCYGFWKIGAKRSAIVGFILLLAFVFLFGCAVSQLIAPPATIFVPILIFCFLFPITSAIVCWKNGAKRIANLVVLLEALAVGVFILRALISTFFSGIEAVT